MADYITVRSVNIPLHTYEAMSRLSCTLASSTDTLPLAVSSAIAKYNGLFSGIDLQSKCQDTETQHHFLSIFLPVFEA